MKVNGLLVLILSCVFGIAYFTGKFWAYDGCCDSELSDYIKAIYVLIDVFKDITFFFFVLRFLLYGV